MDEITKHATVEFPLGTHDARVDDKGRLKLPAILQKYLSGRGEPQVFITTLDTSTVQIYPISIWMQNEKLFDEEQELAEDAELLHLVASEYGLQSEMDSQGRVLIKQNLRELLHLENQAVSLRCFKGVINASPMATHQQRLERAVQNLDAMRSRLKQKGLK